MPGTRPGSPVRVLDVVKEAVSTVCESRPVSTAITIDVSEDLVVTGDSRAVEQIVENLVENAVRYGGREGPVGVRAESSATRVSIVVSDVGTGIEAADLARIFERFYRVDPARSRAEGGTGLGLSIVKHLAESMGGSVSVESELGKGTRFVVELPRSTVPESPSRP